MIMAFTLIWFSIFNCQHMWVISGPHWLDPFLALDDAACVSPLMSMVVRVIQSWGVFKRNNCSALGFSQGGFQTHGCYCRTVSAGHIAYCISKSWLVLRLILLLVRLAGLGNVIWGIAWRFYLEVSVVLSCRFQKWEFQLFEHHCDSSRVSTFLA